MEKEDRLNYREICRSQTNWMLLSISDKLRFSFNCQAPYMVYLQDKQSKGEVLGCVICPVSFSAFYSYFTSPGVTH